MKLTFVNNVNDFFDLEQILVVVSMVSKILIFFGGDFNYAGDFGPKLGAISMIPVIWDRYWWWFRWLGVDFCIGFDDFGDVGSVLVVITMISMI